MAKKVKPKAAAAAAETKPALAGKIFSHVKGHIDPIRILQDAIIKDRLPGTLLFAGPSGIGKRLVALGLAQTLICERRKDEPGERDASACGECGPCIRVAHGNSENVLSVEPQGTGIKIEQAQEVMQFIAYRKLGRARVVILNDAHVLNPQAGNALLKSLEEPPPDTYFVLITSHPGSILTTIRSRSQMIRFQGLSEDVLRELQPKAAKWLIRSAQGSVEAISRLQDGANDWEGARRLALSQLESLVTGKVHESEDFRDAIRERATALFVAQTWQRAVRDFAVTNALHGNVTTDQLLMPDQEILTRSAQNVPLDWLLQLETLCLELEQDINRNVDRTLAFENFAGAVRRAYAGREPNPMI